MYQIKPMKYPVDLPRPGKIRINLLPRRQTVVLQESFMRDAPIGQVQRRPAENAHEAIDQKQNNDHGKSEFDG